MFGDLGKMMKLAGQMKSRLPEMKEKLAETTYTAEAGGGVVSATVNGRLGIEGLTIDPELLADAQTDAAMLEDLITVAVSAAQRKATEAAAEAMKELTGGMDLPALDGLLG